VASIPVSSAYTVADQLRMAQATRYFAWQSAMAKAALGRRVLEIGCGLGNFTEQLRDRECVVGLDVDDACIARHQQRFANTPHIRSFVLDALDPALLELRRERLDSVACLNVLEHIEDDLGLLRRMQELLPTGGRVVLMVPAFMALYGPIDRNLGHYRRYTRASLRDAAAQARLGVREMRFMNTVGFFGWWVNAKILRKTEQSEEQIAVFDRWVVPVMSRVENVVAPPFGQSLFVVLEKF
jgi:SAM-dependent methyltransferase